MVKINGARFFAEVLKKAGVTHVFYLPAIMLQALGELEALEIVRVMVHGEKAAAYMADGYARASRRPGVCMAQQIGASNLAAGLRDPYLACTPLIAITGGPSLGWRYKHAYQEVEDFSQFEAVTKFNARVDDVSRLPDLLRQAFREATTGTPGPVHLQFRGSHGQSIEVDTETEVLVEDRFTRTPPFRPAADNEAISQAAALLANAERPIIVAGGGVVYSDAGSELMALAEKLDIPVATAMNAKGSIPDSHPLSVGVPGTYSRACANQAVYEADLVFFVASHTGSQVTTNWSIPKRGTQVIQLDINPRELGRNYPNATSLCADAKRGLGQLLAAAKARKNPAWIERVQSLVAEWRAEAEVFRNSDAIPMRPERVAKEITDALPEDAIVVSDTGHSGIWTATMIDLVHPTQRYIRCAGSMGWGFPGALGVKCAVGDRPVVCWTGDGAFYYHIAELETAARYGINLVVVVNNNSALNQEIPLVKGAIGGKTPARPKEVWEFNQINFAKVAESFGCIGIRAETPDELKAALAKAFSLKRPVIIDAVTDINAFAKRAWLPQGVSSGH